jgi:protoporphyrinogen oxidase
VTPGTAVVLGAGPTGLSAAFTLGAEATLVEREATVGGCCRSVVSGGFTFDHAGHVLFSKDPYVHDLYRLLLGDNVHWQERQAWIYREGARARNGNGHATNGNGHATNGNGHATNGNGHAANGNGHATNGNGHATNGKIAPFGYPLRGGFQALMDGFLPRLRADLRLDTDAVRICPSKRVVLLSDGSTLDYETLISTIPLPRLVRLLGPEAPSEVHDAAAGLRHRSVRCVHLGVGRSDLTDRRWIDYSGEAVFHRVFLQGNASPYVNPPGGFGLTCEITYSTEDPLPVDGDALIERCVADCRRVGLVGAEDPIWTACQVDLPYASVVYDQDCEERIEHLRAWLLGREILLAGRFSEWECSASDHAFVVGRDAALKARQRWQERRAVERRPGQPSPRAAMAL